MKFWQYKEGPCLNELRRILSDILGVEQSKVFLTENGRTAEYIFLKSLKLPAESNVAIQGFTCNAVVNPVLWCNLKPLYIDIDPMTLNMSFDSLFERIDKDTRVVVLQHTFGNSVFKTKKEFKDFVSKMHKKKILVFEDCAHALGGEIEGQKLGTFGDAALFSFGIEKVLSTRVGGALVVNNEEYLHDIEVLFGQMKRISSLHTFLWLLNPFFWRVLRIFKKKMEMAKFLRKLKLLNMGFEDSELIGVKPKSVPRKISNALSCFVIKELLELKENLSHRAGISKVYGEVFSVEHLGGGEIPFVRFPMVCETKGQKKEILKFFEKEKINGGDWYDPVIYPKSTVQGAMMYETGGCKVAEIVSSRIVNLPTGQNVDEKLAREISKKIISFLDEYDSRGNSGEKKLG